MIVVVLDRIAGRLFYIFASGAASSSLYVIVTQTSVLLLNVPLGVRACTLCVTYLCRTSWSVMKDGLAPVCSINVVDSLCRSSFPFSVAFIACHTCVRNVPILLSMFWHGRYNSLPVVYCWFCSCCFGRFGTCFFARCDCMGFFCHLMLGIVFLFVVLMFVFLAVINRCRF